MTKLELVNWMMYRYMCDLTDKTPVSDYETIQGFIEAKIKFKFSQEVDSLYLLYSAPVFLYFWDKFEEKYKTDVTFSEVTKGVILCRIARFDRDEPGEGATRQEAFYRAVMAWEEER